MLKIPAGIFMPPCLPEIRLIKRKEAQAKDGGWSQVGGQNPTGTRHTQPDSNLF